MCGIVGYIGERPVKDILINGLTRLEYRGYDSAGVAVVNGSLQCVKREGKVDVLAQAINGHLEGSVGIGHTRWATHGEPSDVNAHPHLASDGSFALVHNGIIENYASLRAKLQQEGYEFKSQTDTEVLVHLIHSLKSDSGKSLEESVRQALSYVKGTYGIAIVTEEDPNLLIAARNGSPLIVGVGEKEFFIASDASPIVEHTKQVVYLNDGEMVSITREGYVVTNIANETLTKEVHELEMDLQEIEKGGYEHFMLKEIFGQPDSIRDCMRGRIGHEDGSIKLGGLLEYEDQMRNADRIIICACGTSWHAALVGEFLIEQFARIPVEVEYASEFRYRKPILRENDFVVVVSQSGETADTLAAVRQAKNEGIPVIGICNVVGSTIARETDAGVYLHAGPEIGVASTKAFTAQVTVLTMIAMLLARGRTMTDAEIAKAQTGLMAVPDQIARMLERSSEIYEIAKTFRYASNFLYLGRGFTFPVALEGALKLKEISYIHAEGYPAAEMKHGPIALIDQFMPVVFIAMKDRIYDKVVANIEEVVARKGSVIAITNEGNRELDDLCEFVIEVPASEPYLTPLLTVIPLQLLSYYIAVLRGCHVDQPRNLAKSVTVE